MATADERKQILGMVQENRITAAEGARLLQALQGGAKKDDAGPDARWMRIKVTDLRTGNIKFNINLPIGLVRVGLRMGARFGTGEATFDNEQVMNAIRNGASGKIAEIESSDEGERVEIWLE